MFDRTSGRLEFEQLCMLKAAVTVRDAANGRVILTKSIDGGVSLDELKASVDAALSSRRGLKTGADEGGGGDVSEIVAAKSSRRPPPEETSSVAATAAEEEEEEEERGRKRRRKPILCVSIVILGVS